MTRSRVLAAALLALPLLWPVCLAWGQDYDRPPPGYGGDDQGAAVPQDNGPADSQDPAGLGVRVGRLEGRIREMTGQIEELQNANRKLIEQIQKFQQDVDTRMSSGGRAKRSEATVPSAGATEDGSSKGSAGATPKGPARGDAYDPDTGSNANPGQPKPLGSTDSADENGTTPMDLSGGRLRKSGQASDTLAPTLRLPPKGGTETATPGAPVVASVAPNSPRAEFDAALGYYKGKQYDDAEKGFTAFIQKNPKSRLAADATYYLGESFAQRGRSREAAEQYLKVSTDYAGSTRAPDAMLHLGMSLKALGAKEQACATFTEVGRKYPNAPAYVKTGAEREAKRAQC